MPGRALELGCPAGNDPAMPTVPRRAAAQRARDRLQARRLRAAELFTAGIRQAEVARQLGVSAQAVSVWHATWKQTAPGRTCTSTRQTGDRPRAHGPSGPVDHAPAASS